MARETPLKYSHNSDGDKIIPSSIRSDGSIRPERRIREGYIPQDEQPTYKSKSALERRGYKTCPGSDFIDDQKTGQSKSAKKRERRKQKAKEEEKSGKDPGNSIEDITEKVAGVEITDPEGPSQVSSDEKQMRTLRKKLKQCDALHKRQEAGDVLTEQELEKLSKQHGWIDELTELENKLQTTT